MHISRIYVTVSIRETKLKEKFNFKILSVKISSMKFRNLQSIYQIFSVTECQIGFNVDMFSKFICL